MKISEIYYPTALEKVNINDDNIDLIINTDDGDNYTIVVATPNNIYTLMNKDNKKHYILHAVFVDKLTKENIEALINEMCEDNGYWLKLYGKNK